MKMGLAPANRVQGLDSGLGRNDGGRWVFSAILALAHSLIVSIYHMIARGTRYVELGGNYFDTRAHHYVVDSVVRRIEQ